MRFLILVYLVCNCSFAFSQNNSVKDHKLTISLLETRFHYDIMGNHKKKYSKDGENVEILSDLLVRVRIDGFDENTIIDFNNFSLVEHQFNLRQRPYYVFFNGYFVRKYKVGTEKMPDNFLKYSQENVENFDHYYSEELIFNLEKTAQQRFYPICIKAKENKKNWFLLTIPVKIQKEGDFSLYYKDKLVTKFTAKNKWEKIN